MAKQQIKSEKMVVLGAVEVVGLLLVTPEARASIQDQVI